MITDPMIIQSHGIAVFDHRFPPLFVLLLAWGLGLAMVAASIVGVGIQRGTLPLKPGLVAMLVFVVPVIFIALKVGRIYPPGGTGINVTPAANAVVLGLLAVSIVKYRIYDLLPVGRHQAVEVMGDGYLLINREETIVDHNRMATDLLGGDAQENLKGCTAHSFFPDDLQEVIEERDQSQFTIEGRTIQVLQSAVTSNNMVAGHVLLLRNITEKEERIQELERVNQQLDQFASIVSHDLRNPLNVARGRVDIARKKLDSEDLDIASNALERMQAIIEDVLMLTRQGQAVSDMEWRRLSEIAESCWGNCDTGEANLVIESDLRVQCDPSRLKRLFENLIRNAIDHAGVNSTVRVGSLAGESGFYVADDGPGFPEEDRDRLAEYEYSTVEESSGLGLAIVKEITQAHSWHLRLTESSDGGARIEITDVETEAL
jgi:signal transduction histidine kinase